MKKYNPKKPLKNSEDVRKFCEEKKIKEGLIPYKGGTGLIENGQVIKIFIGRVKIK